MTKLVCECCGGSIDISTGKCPYCDTQYILDKPLNIQDLSSEMRQIQIQLDTEALYSSALKAMRDYAGGERRYYD